LKEGLMERAAIPDRGLGGPPTRLLVVEGEMRYGRGLLWTIERYGGAATLVRTANDACRQLATEASWKGLMVDVPLPDGSGLDILGQARAKATHLPALIITALHDNYIAHAAFQLGAVYLVKPIDDVHVKSFVHRASQMGSNHSHLDDVIGVWRGQYGLSRAEASILTMAAEGYNREAIALKRQCTRLTLKAQIHNIVQKTGDDSLHSAVERALREALARTKSAARDHL
jgi:DNA-binding NarL/FixJ family response regulator